MQISHLPQTLHLTVCFQGWICQQPHWPHWTWHVACYGGLQPYLQGSSLPVNPAIYHYVITLLSKHSIPASSLLETQKRPSGEPLQCGLVPGLNAVYVAAQIPPAEDRNTEWEAAHDCKLVICRGHDPPAISCLISTHFLQFKERPCISRLAQCLAVEMDLWQPPFWFGSELLESIKGAKQCWICTWPLLICCDLTHFKFSSEMSWSSCLLVALYQNKSLTCNWNSVPLWQQLICIQCLAPVIL